jgi:hypothetical protein
LGAIAVLTYEEQLDRDTEWALLEGSMHFEERSAVHKTMHNLARRLDELGIDFVVAGAMAMFMHGYRRFTEVVDMIVTRDDLARIHDALEGRGYVKSFAASKNLRDATTGVKIDFMISGQFPGDGKPGPVVFPLPSQVATELDGVPVLQLTKLVELKLASGQVPHRMKDLADVQGLIGHLSLPREFAEQLDPSLRIQFDTLWQNAQASKADDF